MALVVDFSQVAVKSVLTKGAHTFPRKLRLLRSQDYQAVFRDNSSRSSDQRWSLLARKNESENARLGIAVSKRVLKNAVDRNRIKRIVRESFRCHQHELSGLDIIVMCKAEVKQFANSELFDSLNTHWQRVRSSA